MGLKVSMAPRKVLKWADFSLDMIRGRTLPHSGIEVLIGRLNFAQSATSNRPARCKLRPPYVILYAMTYTAALPPLVRRALYWWYATLIALTACIYWDRQAIP